MSQSFFERGGWFFMAGEGSTGEKVVVSVISNDLKNYFRFKATNDGRRSGECGQSGHQHLQRPVRRHIRERRRIGQPLFDHQFRRFGRELLAHELTHVVQQNGDGIRRKMTLSEPGDPQEVEADQMARAVMEQEHAPRADRQTGGPVDVPKEEDEKAVATQRARDSSSVQRQPEMPAASEEEKKKLQPRLDGDTLARQTEDEQPME